MNARNPLFSGSLVTQAALMAVLLVALLVLLPGVQEAQAQNLSMHFFGGGVDAPLADRVRIPLDDPLNPGDEPGPPADLGRTDFTVECWLRGRDFQNTGTFTPSGPHYDWILGNIFLDRDRFNEPRTYGLSLGGGRVMFGVKSGSGSVYTLSGSSNVLDGEWHHVAVERAAASGAMWLYVDGLLQASFGGSAAMAGAIDYPGNETPGGTYCGGLPCLESDPYFVLGAEKHDAGAEYPSFHGLMDELRLSDTLRYGGLNFAVPTGPFIPDARTLAYYGFNEGEGLLLLDGSGNPLGPSNGEVRKGGFPEGPQWVAENPFEPAGPCAAPEGLQAAAAGTGRIALQWQPSPYADRYEIQGRRVGDPSFRRIRTPDNARLLTGLVPGQAYEWQVRTRCLNGTVSPASSLEGFIAPALRRGSAPYGSP